mmetsp:Transcript_12734/g.20815  ORF Transcript_12734/g.20815 Transcript_12734/m.20815 type:complete len:969 (-) Transcript_12734:429-3335(-)
MYALVDRQDYDNEILAILYDKSAFQGTSIALRGRGVHKLIDREFARRVRSLRVSAGYSISLKGFNMSPLKTFTSDTDYLGDRAEYAVVDRPVCSTMRTITASSQGEYFSSNENPEYENDLHCSWRITAGSGNIISIKFTTFVTEAGHDVLYVYDGLGEDSSASLLLEESGDLTGKTAAVSTRSNTALVTFITDSLNVQSGFTAFAYSVPKFDVTPETSIDTFLANGIYTITSGTRVTYTLNSMAYLGGRSTAFIRFAGDDKGSNIRPSSPQAVLDNSTAQAVFTDIIVTSSPGKAIILMFDVNGIFYTTRLNVRNCTLGEVKLLYGLECTLCPPDKFSRSLADSDCRPCPSGGTCGGGFNVSAQEQYWMSPYTPCDDPIFVKCRNTACGSGANTLCFGASSASGLSHVPSHKLLQHTSDLNMFAAFPRCETGYEGNLCTVCSQNWGRNGLYDCVRCTTSSERAMILSGICVVGSLILFYLVISTIQSEDDNDKESIQCGTMLKLALDYLQVITLIRGLQVSWPPIIFTILDGIQTVLAPAERILSIDCLFGLSPSSILRPFFIRQIFYASLPILSLVFPMIVVILSIVYAYVGKYLFNRPLVDDIYRNIYDLYLCSAIILVYIVLPTSVTSLTGFFGCVDLGGNRSFLLRELSLDCDSMEYRVWAIGFGLVLLVLYGIGVPLLSGLIVYRGSKRGKLEMPSFIRKFGFLYKGYKGRYIMYETFIAIRKNVLAVAISLFVANPSVQGLVAMGIVFLSLSFDVKLFPFETRFINRLNAAGMATSVITLYCGQLFFFTDDNRVSVFLTVVVLAVNICFWSVWIFFFMRKFLTSFARNHPDFLISRYLRRMMVPIIERYNDKSFSAVMEKEAATIVSTTFNPDGSSMSTQSRRGYIRASEREGTSAISSPVSFQNQHSNVSRRTRSADLEPVDESWNRSTVVVGPDAILRPNGEVKSLWEIDVESKTIHEES